MSGTVLLAGGGTAGHVVPALATAAALRAARPDLAVEFVGTARGLEARLVPADGWVLHEVDALPLRRSLSLQNLRVIPALVRATRRIERMISDRDVIAACVFGGYVSGPLALAARRRRVPLVVHEQNAVPGLANRIAARWAAAVAVAVPDAALRFPPRARVVVTGNPVRAELARADLAALRPEAQATMDLHPDRRTLLVFGGSLGARRLNEVIVQTADLWAAPERLQILHLCGTRDYDRCWAAWQDALDASPLHVRCHAFLERMELAYAAADVVVSRAGASTVAEITVAGLPAVLVPYPHGAAQEQAANAGALAAAGAAAVIPDAQLSPWRLVAEAEPMLADDRRRESAAGAARALGRPDAAARLAELVLTTWPRRTEVSA